MKEKEKKKEKNNSRRDFLAAGSAISLASLMGREAQAAMSMPMPGMNMGTGTEKSVKSSSDNSTANHSSVSIATNANSEFREYSRYTPSFGGPPTNKHYMGKLMPGLRPPNQAPVAVHTPDLKKLDYKLVNGVKEFHLRAMAVKRELLPGYFMDVWGYNGSMPGPMIEAYQGDRVRLVLHNDLPEPTTLHLHGFELPIAMDGVPGLVQDLIAPGKSFAYEMTLHQTGTFFYHSHVAMQETMGMMGLFIVHPKIAYEPVVDRDFALVYQNFYIPANSTVVDSTIMDWNWHTINGRSGPYTTPMVVRHGERVRVRLINFSPVQHHPIHFHGHTFWLTGTEGGRIPDSAWIPRNNTLVGVAMAQDFEFIANNPGDWIFHCHMTHHMMNHMTSQVGPRMRQMTVTNDYMAALPDMPDPIDVLGTPAMKTPGYPENMVGMMMSDEMSPEHMAKILNRKEVRGMRKGWQSGVHGLMTVLRVLPDELYDQVMTSNGYVAPGSIFDAIVRGNYKKHP